MDAQVTQVAVRADDRPLTWPKEADIICLFATVEGYFSYRNPVDGSWLVLNLCHQINQWLENYKVNKTDLEFHHLLIRVNAAIGKFQSKNPHLLHKFATFLKLGISETFRFCLDFVCFIKV